MPLKPPCPLKNLPKGRNLYHVHFEIISDIIGDAKRDWIQPFRDFRPNFSLSDW